jgi:ELWxxDGT repeat protein
VYIDGGTRLAFGADGVGADIWVTDGTAVGTHSMLEGTSAPRSQLQYGSFSGVNDSVLFRVNDPVNGPVVWKTDGTAAGTRHLFDVDPGSTDNRPPSGFRQNGNRVYFSAFRSGIGNEPWHFSLVSPNASDDFAETPNGTAINVSVTANDSDFDSSLSAPGIEILTTPANGTATLSSGVITYTPNDGFSGIDRFTYRVLDAQGNPSNAAWVSVTTRAAASSTNPGTAPAPPAPPPPPPSPSPKGGGGGGALGWEVLLLALLLLPRLRQHSRRPHQSRSGGNV